MDSQGMSILESKTERWLRPPLLLLGWLAVSLVKSRVWKLSGSSAWRLEMRGRKSLRSD